MFTQIVFRRYKLPFLLVVADFSLRFLNRRLKSAATKLKRGRNIMQVTLEKLSGLKRKLKIVIPAERASAAIQKKLKELAATIKMPGFRPGKVPFDTIKQRYSGSVRAEILEDLIRDSYIKAIKEQELKPAGHPKIEDVSFKDNEPISFSATIEVYPEIKLADFSEVTLEKHTAKISDAEIDEVLNRVRKERATWQEITDKSHQAQADNQVTVTFTVTELEDPDVKPSTEKDVTFILGNGSMWPEFEKNIYSMQVDEIKKYILEFPKTHVDEKLAGKKAEFEVQMHKICSPLLPELDDEFAAQLGIKEGGLEKLKEQIRIQLENNLQANLKESFRDAVLKKLLEINPIEIPQILIENDLDRMAHNAKSKKEFPREKFTAQAKDNAALGLLLSTVIDVNSLKVEPQELQDEIMKIASAYPDANKILNNIISNEKHLMEIQANLLEQKALDFLASQATVTEKEISYKDAIA